MTDRVPADTIEATVGARRHPREHIIRGDYSNGRAYILHSAECLQRYADLRNCPWSLALDRGDVWLSSEAAKAKFYRAHPEYPADGSDWEYVAEQYRQLFIDSVTRTLTPVYADIQAEAIRQLVDALEAKSQDTWEAEPGGKALEWHVGITEAIRLAESMADELEGDRP